MIFDDFFRHVTTGTGANKVNPMNKQNLLHQFDAVYQFNTNYLMPIMEKNLQIGGASGSVPSHMKYTHATLFSPSGVTGSVGTSSVDSMLPAPGSQNWKPSTYRVVFDDPKLSVQDGTSGNFEVEWPVKIFLYGVDGNSQNVMFATNGVLDAVALEYEIESAFTPDLVMDGGDMNGNVRERIEAWQNRTREKIRNAKPIGVSGSSKLLKSGTGSIKMTGKLSVDATARGYAFRSEMELNKKSLKIVSSDAYFNSLLTQLGKSKILSPLNRNNTYLSPQHIGPWLGMGGRRSSTDSLDGFSPRLSAKTNWSSKNKTWTIGITSGVRKAAKAEKIESFIGHEHFGFVLSNDLVAAVIESEMKEKKKTEFKKPMQFKGPHTFTGKDGKKTETISTIEFQLMDLLASEIVSSPYSKSDSIEVIYSVKSKVISSYTTDTPPKKLKIQKELTQEMEYPIGLHLLPFSKKKIPTLPLGKILFKIASDCIDPLFQPVINTSWSLKPKSGALSAPNQLLIVTGNF